MSQIQIEARIEAEATVAGSPGLHMSVTAGIVVPNSVSFGSPPRPKQTLVIKDAVVNKGGSLAMFTGRSRTVYNNQTLFDQADFFTGDDFTRVTGLTTSQVTTQLFFNNQLQSWLNITGVSVTDNQVASGHIYWLEVAGSPGIYGVRLRPNAVGHWRLLITYADGTQIVALDYDVVAVATVETCLRASFVLRSAIFVARLTMSVAFSRGQVLGRADLNVFLSGTDDVPRNAAEISYSLYDVTTGAEVLLGVPRRNPANPSVGEYYASVLIPLDANLGSYIVRWTFRELVGGPIQQVAMEFSVIDKEAPLVDTLNLTVTMRDLIRRLRIGLRDNNPDRNYHFRPPAHEETVRQYNKVFGFIWEDSELDEYIQRGLDSIISAPPRTPFSSVDQLAQSRPEWKTILLWAAQIHALQALRLNWISDEFSVAPETDVTVGLPDGRLVSLPIADLFAIVHDDDEP